MVWNHGRVGNGEKMEEAGDRIEGKPPERSGKGTKVGEENSKQTARNRSGKGTEDWSKKEFGEDEVIFFEQELEVGQDCPD